MMIVDIFIYTYHKFTGCPRYFWKKHIPQFYIYYFSYFSPYFSCFWILCFNIFINSYDGCKVHHIFWNFFMVFALICINPLIFFSFFKSFVKSEENVLFTLKCLEKTKIMIRAYLFCRHIVWVTFSPNWKHWKM